MTKKHNYFKFIRILSISLFCFLFFLPLILQIFSYELFDFGIQEKYYLIILFLSFLLFVLIDYFYAKQKYRWFAEFIVNIFLIFVINLWNSFLGM